MAIDKVVSASITDSAVTDAKLSFNANQFRNLIINGDMNISQRGTSFTGLTNGTPQYTLDRYKFSESGSMTSVYTYSQETDVPTGQGFAKSLKIQNTTAGSGHNVIETIQYIEAQNCQYLKFGTSNAESLTLSFWVKCTETGTGNIALYNLDSTRMIAKNYTISSANTWEKITLTFPGDTSGTINNDNGAGLAVFIPIAAAGSYNTGTPGSWQAYSNGLRGAGMTIDLSNNTSDNIYITGMQLEAGTSASDFEFLPYDVNLERCLRYYELLASGDNQVLFNAFYYTATEIRTVYHPQVSMRANPTLDQTSGTDYYRFIRDAANDKFDDFTLDISSPTAVEFFNSTDMSGVQGESGWCRTDVAASYIALDAEL